MVTETTSQESKDNHAKHYPLLEIARRVLLAGIGAVALAQDEIEDFVNRLVERGEIAEKDGRKLVREIMDRRKKDAEKVEDEVGKRVEDILSRINIPTRTDLDILSEKITSLAKMVDELKKSQTGS